MTRFDRQIPILGDEGQNKLFESRVAIVGCGGLGSNVAIDLAMAGVGHLTLIDDDSPSESNFNRQFVYFGKHGHKSGILADYVSKISPETCVTSIADRLTDDNASEILRRNDIIVDCLDNNSTRLALNRFVLKNNVPLVHGGVDSLIGQVTVVVPGKTPCLECILGKDSDKTVDSIGSVVSAIASIQSTEVIKMVTGVGEPLIGKVLFVDMASNSYRTVDVSARKDCPACGKSIRD